VEPSREFTSILKRGSAFRSPTWMDASPTRV